jgi:hypothetical protein
MLVDPHYPANAGLGCSDISLRASGHVTKTYSFKISVEILMYLPFFTCSIVLICIIGVKNV